MTVTAITVTVAVFRPMSINMIAAIATEYGVDKDIAFSIASEVLAAKKVAESDMRYLMYNKK